MLSVEWQYVIPILLFDFVLHWRWLIHSDKTCYSMSSTGWSVSATTIIATIAITIVAITTTILIVFESLWLLGWWRTKESVPIPIRHDTTRHDTYILCGPAFEISLFDRSIWFYRKSVLSWIVVRIIALFIVFLQQGLSHLHMWNVVVLSSHRRVHSWWYTPVIYCDGMIIYRM